MKMDVAPGKPAPLKIEEVRRVDENDALLMVWFNRAPSDEELQDLQQMPPPLEAARAASQFASELIYVKLVARLFRTLILGGVVLPETPAAMDWLRDYIDGNLEGHGPLGKPMCWPEKLLGICALLRKWGYQPTDTVPPYVRPAKKGTVQ